MAPSLLSTSIAAMLAIASLGNAHIMITKPVPFGKDTLNTSPLANAAIGSAGSDFPCKQRAGVYKISEMNNMKVGESQTLAFSGSASHGGGTCQLAVSLDKEPTANSTWKLIQVYEGGCPITASGNAGTDTFTYKIPDKFPNGQATLAWTWYNRIGNREIYMNCAPITVEGGSDNNDFYNTLPDMYIINLPTSECSTRETFDQIIPYPGQYIVKGDPGNQHVSATGPGCAAAAASQTAGVQGYSGQTVDNGAGTADSSAAGSGAGSGSAPQATAAPSYNNGQYTQAAAPQAGIYTAAAAAPQGQAPAASGMTTVVSPSVLSLSVAAPTSAAAAAPTNAVPAYPSSNANGSNTAGTGSGSGAESSPVSGSGSAPAAAPAASSSGTSCSPDGAIVCNGETQFGLCNWGSVVWQDVAAGTTCSNGVISRKLVRKDSVHFRAHFDAADS